jgi:hypothetical protein
LTDEIEEEDVEKRNKNRQNFTPVRFKVQTKKQKKKKRAKDIADKTQEGRCTQFYFTNQMHNINYRHANINGVFSTCSGTSVPSSGGTMYQV